MSISLYYIYFLAAVQKIVVLGDRRHTKTTPDTMPAHSRQKKTLLRRYQKRL